MKSIEPVPSPASAINFLEDYTIMKIAEVLKCLPSDYQVELLRVLRRRVLKYQGCQIDEEENDDE